MPMKSVLFSTSVTNISPLALGTLPLGNVAHDLRRADDVSGVIFDRRDRERNNDALAVAAHALGFEVLDSLSLFQAGDDFIFFGQTFGRDHERDVLAHSLLGGVTEELFSGSVPALDNAVE